MHVATHHIGTGHSATSHTLTSLHFGGTRPGKKVYIQGGLHADEVPGMLAAHHLRGMLATLEEQGRIHGEIVLVPAANPIGLAQAIQGAPFGRFDLTTGTNFNRGFRHVAEALKTRLAGRLGFDAAANVATIRAEAREELACWEPATDAEALKKLLLGLAIDADIVLDLHCDNEACVHVYTGTPLAEQFAPLAALLGARALLTALAAGEEPFDEACSRLWWDLAAHFGPAVPIPPACLAATIELRGEMDVTHAHAGSDAHAIAQFLARHGVLDLPADQLPPSLCQATPLEGVQPLSAPHAGVLVFTRELGEQVESGDTLAELIDPVAGTVTRLTSAIDGVLFARTAHRHLLRGMQVCKVAGATPFRSGNLLSQ